MALKTMVTWGQVTWVIFLGRGWGVVLFPPWNPPGNMPSNYTWELPAARVLGSIFMCTTTTGREPKQTQNQFKFPSDSYYFYTSGLPNTNWQLLVPMILLADCYLVELDFILFLKKIWGGENPSGFWGFL